jgi:hypothetical protein
MEEQAVFPRPNERSPQYDIAKRNAKLDPKKFPILREGGPFSMTNLIAVIKRGSS